MRLGIVCAQFNEEITSRMKKAALKKAKEMRIEVVSVLEVPGVYDIPYAVQLILEKRKSGKNAVDAIATLGAVIKGDTDHDDLITRVATKALTKLSLQYQKPISLGIIGPGATEEQANKRAEEYAERAVEAALALHSLKV
jgi:6,7-dimethyl-8-ribityllumazine synthase